MGEARRSDSRWRRSDCADGACVEVKVDNGGEVLVRSSLRPAAVLRLSAHEWSAFLEGAARGDFDDPRD